MAFSTAARTTPAAQYLRMSTEHQAYSIDHQLAAIAAYAVERGYEIVRTYADAGISGLGLRRRKALQSLLSDVLGGEAGYSAILVYDVSRWGRFQDPDQSAHYEFICREAGVRVEYCAESFDNDGSLSSIIVKSLKRAMAAEYSRELSAKISAASRRSASRGFWVGGPPGYGLRRRIVRRDGTLGDLLQHGDFKATQADRITLVPGPADEVEVVGRIYRLFVIAGLSCAGIAQLLNTERRPAELGRPWTGRRVRQVLTSEKYVGVNVFGKILRRLDKPPRRQPPAAWLRVADAFAPLVAPEMFRAAQAQMRHPKPHATDEQLLAGLADLLAREGRLSAGLINRAEVTQCVSVYQRRFGTLMDTYDRVGYRPSGRQVAAARVIRARLPHLDRRFEPDLSDDELLTRLADLLARTGSLSVQAINAAPDLPNRTKYSSRFGGLRRAYALVGFTPTGAQARALARCGGQSITAEAAAALAEAVRQGGGPAGFPGDGEAAPEGGRPD